MKKFDPETFGPLLGGTARAWRMKLDQRLKPMGLSQAKWRTLIHLSRAPEPLTQSQIAERTGIEEPTLVSLLHRLEKEGWVVRKNSARDRRCKTVHLQPRTERVINRINATALKLRHQRRGLWQWQKLPPKMFRCTWMKLAHAPRQKRYKCRHR